MQAFTSIIHSYVLMLKTQSWDEYAEHRFHLVMKNYCKADTKAAVQHWMGFACIDEKTIDTDTTSASPGSHLAQLASTGNIGKSLDCWGCQDHRFSLLACNIFHRFVILFMQLSKFMDWIFQLQNSPSLKG